MSDRLLLTLAATSLGWLGALGPVQADIYNWVDESGNVTVSNVAPPQGVRVTRVVRMSAAEAKASAAAADAARATQLRELTDRVRELEQEVQSARSGPPPDYAYQAFAPPMNRAPSYTAQYVVVEQPSPPQTYAPYGCDPTWSSCWNGFAGPLVYPGVVVVHSGRHHHHPSRGGGRGGGSPRPMAAPTLARMR